jgi:Protein of unknown function (DUF1592)/Protein of unknown function (DUF1588)/Protein of unknown function (DUF1585)/Protein of unknown function (DUF1587)/Protein of unknown function (DUF1595)/Ca-dependent carbohydrate-binding module xylan-binding
MFRSRYSCACLFLTPLVVMAAGVGRLGAEETASQRAARRAVQWEKQIQPLMARYCYDCHGGAKTEADLSLVDFKTPEQILKARKSWQVLLQKVETGAMPLEEARLQPTKDERQALVDWISAALTDVDCSGSPDPGRVTLRRLNRREYRNTVRDLVGIDYEPSREFPGDDTGYGFDNIGDVLSLPPVLMEKYLDAAEEIASKAIDAHGGKTELDKRIVGANLKGDGAKSGFLSWLLTSDGEASANFEIPGDGEYEIRVLVSGDQAGDEPVKMAVRLDGKDLEKFDVTSKAGTEQEIKSRTRLAKGSPKIGVAFLNDFYNPNDPQPDNRDRNLYISMLHLRGPLDAKDIQLPPMHKQIVFATPGGRTTRKEASEQVIRRLATRAFRRPATDDEVARLVKLAEQARGEGDNFEQSIQVALQAILISPHFLYRMELDPVGQEGKPRNLNDLEVASRLSYFLWSSMPDEELLNLATAGKLRQDGNLEKQTRRLLVDAKSKALAENFAGQWLELRSLDLRTPDKQLFPRYDDGLKRAMRTETEMFFETIVREDRSIFDLLAADFTFVNEKLAEHYGLKDVRGDAFRRVSLAGTERGGILTQASILTVTSNPNRTSPVKRGKWILENILGSPPPPPPPNVPELKEPQAGVAKGTLRERLEQHRVNPGCASCHKSMDPLGFALENFDAIGAWRDKEGDSPIDSAGQLPSGEKFRGPQELRKLLLAARKPQFARCLTEKLLTYALGRGVEYSDQCAVTKITAPLEKDQFRFSRLVVEIVSSDPFLKKSSPLTP